MHAFAFLPRGRARSLRRPGRQRWSGALTTLAALLALLTAPAVASAAVGTIEVVVDGSGRVAAAGIDCPGDCADSDAWPDEQPPPQKILRATPSPGFRTEWQGCRVTSGRPNECTATFDENGTVVTVRFVDVEPPTVSFAAPSPLDGAIFGRNSVGPTYAVDADDNGGVVRVEFRDGDTLYDTVRTAPWRAAPRGLLGRADGTYVIRATAYDAAGNATSIERRLRYDGTSPVLRIAEGTQRFTSGQTTTIDWTAADDNLATPPNQRCGYKLRPSMTFLQVPCAHPLVVGHAAEGVWDVWLWVQDDAGNATQEFVVITVDRVAPQAPRIVAGIPEGGVSGTRASWLQLAPPADEPTDGLTWNCRANGVPVNCSNGVASWTAPPGTTAVEFRASVTDRAGNESPSVERRWTVDEAPPVVRFTEGPAEGAVIPAGDVTIAWSVPDRYDPSSRCSWHDEDSTPCAQHRVTRRVTPGTYRLDVTVEDVRGLETTLVRSFTVVAAPDPGPGGGDPDPGGDPGPGQDPGPGSGAGTPSGGGTPPGAPGPPPILPGVGGLPDVPGGPPSGGSSAKRCVVPRVKRRATLKAARRQLTRAGCRVKVKRVRAATVKRGRVVSLSVKAGTTRPYRATVTIRVSRGRR